MSNELAIAAVTRTIQSVLGRDGDMLVTTKTPDQAAQETGSGRRINVFLYHTMPNPTWRNLDIPGKVRSGEAGNPPLALNLHYLLTSYGEEGTDLADQRLLGQAMRILHDRAILKRDDIRLATQDDRDLRDSDLHEQVEHVRVAPDTLNIEEMSRLWTTFQTQYRVSAAYQASVVLIESKRPTRSALPVAKRGQDDRGVQTNLGLDAVLAGVEYRADPQQPALPAAHAGSTVTVVGSNLPGTGLSVVVRDPKQEPNGSTNSNILARLTPTVEVAGQRLRVTLSEVTGIWPAGMLSLEVEYHQEGRPISSNSVPLALAPEIQTSDVEDRAIAFVNETADGRSLSVSLRQPLGNDRRVLLILNRFEEPRPDGGTSSPQRPTAFYQIPQLPDGTGVGNFNPSFNVSNVVPGTYWLRIRADGIDSLLMNRTQNSETNRWSVDFDPKQKVTI